MSYTPPSINAVDFDFSVDVGYTSPAIGAVDFDFSAESARQATGFSATQFGAPSIALVAAPISGTQFGTHGVALSCAATGFAGTQFGEATNRIACGAEGSLATQIGAPTARLTCAAQGVSSSSFGEPVATYSQQAQATSDAPQTQFGTPAVQLGLFGAAEGWQATQFGTPNTTLTQSASGIAPSVVFGHPQRDLKATGFSAAAFGLHGLIHNAIPIAATQFGQPTCAIAMQASAIEPTIAFGLPQYVLRAAGFSATQFGAHGVANTAVGIRSTQFGAASLRFDASGWQAGQFGAPSGYQHFNAQTLGRVTQWSWPWTGYTPADQDAPVYGFKATKFGYPLRYVAPMLPANKYVAASGFKASVFGAATTGTGAEAQASGERLTQFGTPTSRQQLQAAGLNGEAQFGAASVAMAGLATGSRVSQFGTPGSRRTQAASGLYRPTRWGVSSAARSNTYKAWPTGRKTRFGRPLGYQRFNYPATGLCSTQFGAPDSFDTHRSAMLAPSLRFGKPLLKRTPTC